MSDRDRLEEEMAIMEERASEPPVIRTRVLDEPIRTLCNRAAVSVDASETVHDAIRAMQENRFGSVLVKDGPTLVGIVTERDVLYKVAGKDLSVLKSRVTEIMTPSPETLRLDDSIVYLMNKMHVGGFRHIPILDENEDPQYVVSLRGVLGYLLDEFGTEVLNVPPDPRRKPSEPYGG